MTKSKMLSNSFLKVSIKPNSKMILSNHSLLLPMTQILRNETRSFLTYNSPIANSLFWTERTGFCFTFHAVVQGGHCCPLRYYKPAHDGADTEAQQQS